MIADNNKTIESKQKDYKETNGRVTNLWVVNETNTTVKVLYFTHVKTYLHSACVCVIVVNQLLRILNYL